MAEQKKNGSLPRSGNRSISYQHKRRKPESILHQMTGKCKPLNWRKVAVVVIAFTLVAVLVQRLNNYKGSIVDNGKNVATHENMTSDQKILQQPERVFIYCNNASADTGASTEVWNRETSHDKCYVITDGERYELASVITAEAVGEPFEGKIAVAQCILQACRDDGIRPLEVLEKYAYSTRRPEPTEEALEAVAAVFDSGHVATSEPIKYFYAPNFTVSEWHESQEYVMTINNHKFFKEADK